jgi:sulfate permease, SulP family
MRTTGRRATASGVWPVAGIGLVAGFMEVAVVLSFSALLFSGLGPSAYAMGAGYVLVGTALANLLVSRWSSMPGALVVPQDTSTAILATASTPLLAGLAAGERFGSMLVYIAAAGLATGVVMLLIGALRQGGLVRFVPLPVIGGFLAGTGYLLVIGGAEVITAGYEFTTTSVTALVAGTVFALAMLLILRYRPRPGLVPACVVGGAALFFAALAVAGISFAEARSLGLLFEPSDVGFGLPFGEIATANWSILTSGWGGIVTVPLVATLGMLLNVNALEMTAGRDADLDRELRMVGATNAVVSVTGTPAVYHTVGMTSLGYRVGVRSRWVPVVVAATCLLAMVIGGELLALLPVPVAGGLLIFLGFGFITDWFVDRRRQMTGSEVLLMAAIVLAVATMGFLAAVGLGMIAAVIIFAIRYASIDPVRHHGNGTEMRSTVDRPAAAESILTAEGHRIMAVQLHGFLFFGTAKIAIDRVDALMEQAHDLSAVVLDLERVTGADATGISSIVKLVGQAVNRAGTAVVSRIPDTLRAELESVLRSMRGVEVTSDLDHGLEFAENALIGERADPVACSPGEVFGEEVWRRIRPSLGSVVADAGDVIIDVGDTATGLFVVESGRVVTEIPVDGGYRRVRLSGPGAIVGEMSLYRSGVRSARVVAREPSTLLQLDGETVARIEADDPELAVRLHRLLASVMAERVAQGNAAVVALLR